MGRSGRIGVTLITNQDNGISSYANGDLLYHPPQIVGWVSRPARLSTTGLEPLNYHFSDRKYVLTDGQSLIQPFWVRDTDRLGLSIAQPYLGVGGVVAKFTLRTWANATFSVPLEPKGNLLVGLGPPIGNETDHAVYVLSFHDVEQLH